MSAPQRRWAARVPHMLWAPLTGSGLILLVGLLGLAAHQPWLFPSLGPTAFLQVEAPNQPTSRFYNTLVGHALGLSIGMLAVVLTGAQHAPSVLASHELILPCVLAAVLAVAGTLLFSVLLALRIHRQQRRRCWWRWAASASRCVTPRQWWLAC